MKHGQNNDNNGMKKRHSGPGNSSPECAIYPQRIPKEELIQDIRFFLTDENCEILFNTGLEMKCFHITLQFLCPNKLFKYKLLIIIKFSL